MSFSSWLRTWKHALARSAFGDRRCPPRPARRVGVEALEDRIALTAGALASTFGAAGLVTTDLPGYITQGSNHTVAVQEDGKTLFACSSPNSTDFAVLRYNVDGSLDTSFGQGGTALVHFSPVDLAFCVAVQPDGKIIVAG